MCNAKEFSGTEIPAATYDRLCAAWQRFIADPSDWRSFDALDWAAKIFSVRMERYSTARRCAAGAKWRPPDERSRMICSGEPDKTQSTPSHGAAHPGRQADQET